MACYGVRWCFRYPIVTKNAFQAFSCHKFEDGTEWLRVDVSVECNTAEHDKIKWLARVAIVVYPVGLWLLNLFLLRCAGPAIMNNLDTKMRTATQFLHAAYVPERYWWELCEMARRCDRSLYSRQYRATRRRCGVQPHAALMPWRARFGAGLCWWGCLLVTCSPRARDTTCSGLCWWGCSSSSIRARSSRSSSAPPSAAPT